MEFLDSSENENKNSTQKEILNSNSESKCSSFFYRRHTSSKKFSRYSNSLKYFFPYRKSKGSQNILRIDQAGFFSLMTFSWLTEYIFKAYKKGLTWDDIPLCSPLDSCLLNAERLEFLWEKAISEKGQKKASFEKVIWKFIRTRVLISCLAFAVSCFLGFLSPTFFMRKLLENLDDSQSSRISGTMWALALCCTEMMKTMFFALYYCLSYRTGLRLRSACLTTIYKKILKLNSTKNTSLGEIINLYGFDGPRIFYMIIFGPMVVGGPIISIFSLLYIYYTLGSWALLGMTIFVLYYPFQFLLSRVTGYYRQRAVNHTDKRMKLMAEILINIKMIKMYSWEFWFSSCINDIRKCELQEIEKIAYCQSLGISLAPTVPVISGIITFLVHVSAGGNLTSAQAFTILVILHTQLRTALLNMRYGCEHLIQGRIISKRFQKVLTQEENFVELSNQLGNEFSICIEDGIFSWNSTTKSLARSKRHKAEKSKESLVSANKCEGVLNSINLKVLKGTLIGICGSVGAGKSSLLLACLGQMNMISGKISRNGNCAFVNQECWLENISIRQNILFGEKFEPNKYNYVLQACNLNYDINLMSAKDETKVGNFGATLSGGQKQRICLARALYSDRDVYFLDDPFSAIDPQLAIKIFDEYVLIALKEKTVFLITWQPQFLKKCDEILVMKDGRIVERGTYSELLSSGQEFGLLMKSSELISAQKNFNEYNDKIIEQEDYFNLQRTNVTEPTKERMRGTIKAYAYHAYIKASGGYFVAFLTMLFILLNVGSNIFSSWWLAAWIKAGSGNITITEPLNNETKIGGNINDNPNLCFYMKTYVYIIGLIVITFIIRCIIFTKITMRASRILHRNLFNKILNSPLEYFLKTPIGQIQNLFSRDFDDIDSRLPESLGTMVQNIWMVIFSLLSIILVFNWFLIPLLIISYFYYFISNVFRAAIRDLKRMENISRNPVFNLVSSTIKGLSVIHSFNKENYYLTQFSQIFDNNSTILYLSSNAMRWMAVRLDFLSVIINLMTSLSVIILKDKVSPAYAGLALAYSAQLCGVFQYTIRLMSENEEKFIAVEKIQNNVKNLIQEGNTKSSLTISPNWPSKGEIKFQQVKMSYGSDLPNILDEVSFSIAGGEKIGFIGRTGAGKSSLIAALLRLVEINSGVIYIDAVNIAKIPLSTLRSCLSVIPQEPVLFNNSLRSNIDPFNRYNDDEIWDALRKTKLGEKVKLMPNKLNTYLGEGEYFSAGEKQLVCLARVLLRKTKVLILDEATAYIDPETEIAIQTVIEEEFKNCTVITIAHRLSALTKCDRILIVDQGKVLQF